MSPRKIAAALLLRWPIIGRRYCVVCESSIGGFLPYRRGGASASPVARALRVVGSDLDNFECPRCGAHDRERHLLLYLRASGLWDSISDAAVLHVAPEKRLSRLIAGKGPRRHVLCDLIPVDPAIERVDVQRMPYPDATFDLVIANHVLEHVADDEAAMREIGRVLVPGGHAILQTPFSAILRSTVEDEGIQDPALRWLMYGQEDHVRLYGRDISDRLASSGHLSACVANHEAMLADSDPTFHGVNHAEPFMVFRKDRLLDHRSEGTP